MFKVRIKDTFLKVANKKNLLSLFILAGLVFSVVQITRSATPNPGHIWAEIGDNTSDTLSPARGGTGTNLLTMGSIILGNGTNAVKLVAPGTSGNLLTSNGATWASATSPSALTGAVFLLYADETNSAVLNTSTTETMLKNWNTGIVNTTYSYYMLEIQAESNLTNRANLNCVYNWNFREGTPVAPNAIENFQWRSITWAIAGARNNATNFAGTMKAIVASTAVPNNANFFINGQMNLSHANATMIVRSFRVYGIK